MGTWKTPPKLLKLVLRTLLVGVNCGYASPTNSIIFSVLWEGIAAISTLSLTPNIRTDPGFNRLLAYMKV